MGDLVSHALDAGLGRGIGNRLPHLDLAHFGTGGKHARRHIGAHMAGARNKQFGCIRPSQPLGTERSGGTGAKSSDGGGIEQLPTARPSRCRTAAWVPKISGSPFLGF